MCLLAKYSTFLLLKFIDFVVKIKRFRQKIEDFKQNCSDIFNGKIYTTDLKIFYRPPIIRTYLTFNS